MDLFVRQQPIQRAMPTLVVDFLNGYPQQILQRRGAIPALGPVQLAGGLHPIQSLPLAARKYAPVLRVELRLADFEIRITLGAGARLPLQRIIFAAVARPWVKDVEHRIEL